MHVEFRGHFGGVSSVIPPCGSPKLDLTNKHGVECLDLLSYLSH